MAALDLARKWMDEHDVSDTDLAFDGEEVVKEDVKRGMSDRDQIRWKLAGGVGKFCDCKVWGGKRSDTITFLGLESDVIFASWLLDTLETFVRRASLAYLADMFEKPRAGETDIFGTPLNGKERDFKRHSFLVGCLHRIVERLGEAARARETTGQSNGRSLVVKKNVLVERKFRELNITLNKGRRSSYGNLDDNAVRRGIAAGDRAQFSRPVNGRQSGALAIGSR